MLKAAKAYLATQVSTSSQGDLLLMLYDTAIKHLHQAVEKMQAKDFAGKGVLISKAINIVSELQESLNKERGGDISKNLFQLYFYCNTRLLTANLKMKPEMVEEVIGILSGLRQAFAQIMPSADGVASLNQQGVVSETSSQASALASAAPAAAAPRPVVSLAAARPAPAMPSVYAAPASAAVSALGAPAQAAAETSPQEAGAAAPPAAVPPVAPPAEPAAPPDAPATTGPVNPMRFRAANAYATSR